MHEHDHKTFRQSSTINITIYKRTQILKFNKTKLVEKAGQEHSGQLTRINMDKPKNCMDSPIVWKKVDRALAESRMKEMNKKKPEDR